MGGLLNEVMLVIVIISFGTALAHFLDVLYICKRLKQCTLRRELKSKRYNGFTNQWEANLIFEGQEPYLTDIYPPLVIPFLVVAFYLPIFPLGGSIAALGYIISHLIFMVSPIYFSSCYCAGGRKPLIRLKNSLSFILTFCFGFHLSTLAATAISLLWCIPC